MKVSKRLAIIGTFFAILFIVNSSFAKSPDIGLRGGLTDSIAERAGYDTVGVSDTTLSESIGKLIKVALSFVGTLFFALTIYAGFLWMTASGNEEQVAKAQSIIKMAVIGMIITLASYGITVYVLSAIALSSRNTTCVGSTDC